MAIWFIFAAMCIIAIVGGVAYLALIRFDNHIRNLWNELDNSLKNRLELLPSIRSFSMNFNELIPFVTELSALAKNNFSDKTFAERCENEIKITQQLKVIFSKLTKSDDLTKNGNFVTLQKSVYNSEKKIKKLRKKYNYYAKRFNAIISIIPINLIASMCELEEKNYFDPLENNN